MALGIPLIVEIQRRCSRQLVRECPGRMLDTAALRRGEAVGIVDYEKLKIQHTELQQTMRARDRELPLLRLDAGKANQVRLGALQGLIDLLWRPS